MQISVIQAFLLSVWYWFTISSMFYSSNINRPVILAPVVGLILGDVVTAIKIGAIIQPMFLAFTGAGGTVVWDPQAGTIMGCVIVMSSNLPLEQALTVALPVSLLFAQLHTVRRIWFAYPAAMADKAALKGNDRAIIFYGGIFCQLSRVVIFMIPMFISIMLGAEAIGRLMANFPVWLKNAMNAVGGMLPAIGMAMTVRVIGRRELLPFFLGGFFLVQYTKIGGMYLALIGAFVMFVYSLTIKSDRKDEDTTIESADVASQDAKLLLTKKDVTRMWMRWIFYAEQSNSFARLQSIAFCIAFVPMLKKLYGNDPQAYSDALTRHLMFFNTDGIVGSLIFGIVAAMEEQRALGVPIDAAAIIGIKAGLMGPFAGIGDTIKGSIYAPLVIILLLPLAQQGNIMGPILTLVIICAGLWSLAYSLCHMGYRLGTQAALTVLKSGSFIKFIDVASVLGLFMLGGISASMVKVTTPIWIATGATPVLVQKGLLDAIVPGLLPLGVLMGVYAYLQKGTIQKAVLLLTVFGLVLSALGVFGDGGLLFKAYVAPKK